MLQFRYRRIPILFCAKEHPHSLYTCEHENREVIEAIGTGLAIQPKYFFEADRGKRVAFPCRPEARVTAVQKHSDRDTITIIINVYIRDTCIGIVENEYASMLAVLDVFDIEDLAEIWEVLDE